MVKLMKLLIMQPSPAYNFGIETRFSETALMNLQAYFSTAPEADYTEEMK
jgi:hypothetical protein